MIRFGKSRWSSWLHFFLVVGWPYIDIVVEVAGYWVNFCIDRTDSYHWDKIDQVEQFPEPEIPEV